jgi:bifunctional non-homologous end joining protein LigD
MSHAKVSLYFQEGSSDKEYHVQIEDVGSGYVVNFQYGRRGNALQTGTKTARPVLLHEANKIYDKLVKEKLSKGYTPGKTGVQYTSTVSDDYGIAPKVHSELSLQLLNEIDESDADKYINDPKWGMQEKFDGRRLAIRVLDGKAQAINKKGQIIDTNQAVIDMVKSVGHNITVDGEIVGETYHIFDLITFVAEDAREWNVEERHSELTNTKALAANVVPMWTTTAEKRKAFDELRAANKEGVVFKLLDSTYTGGRPSSGGSQIKCKFWDSATVVVTSVSTSKRSAGVSVQWRDDSLFVGNVTIPPNYDVPAVGAIVEVKYLYYNPGGALYQPQYKGVRDDQDIGDCLYRQLKAKNSPEDDE